MFVSSDSGSLLKIALVLAVVGSVTACQRVTSYPMGQDRFQVTVESAAVLSREDTKEKWYEEASQLCPRGFTVEHIGETTDKTYNVSETGINTISKPGLKGVIRCD